MGRRAQNQPPTSTTVRLPHWRHTRKLNCASQALSSSVPVGAREQMRARGEIIAHDQEHGTGRTFVGVVLHGHFPVRLLNLAIARIRLETKRCVQRFVVHVAAAASPAHAAGHAAGHAAWESIKATAPEEHCCRTEGPLSRRASRRACDALRDSRARMSSVRLSTRGPGRTTTPRHTRPRLPARRNRVCPYVAALSPLLPAHCRHRAHLVRLPALLWCTGARGHYPTPSFAWL